MPHDVNPGIGAPELIDHPPGNYDCVVNDVALSHREYAVDLTGDLYLVKATDKTVTIARKEGGDK